MSQNFTLRSMRRSLSPYWPLLALILITALAGRAVEWHTGGGLMVWMHYFMGFFLCSFSMLKIFNLAAFANGFRKYDLLAKQVPAYGFLYPFIELTLGLGFLSFVAPIAVYGVTFFIMAAGSAGVLWALKKGLNMNCPCMGSVLQVPLSIVTLTENIGMAAMAAIMLYLTA